MYYSRSRVSFYHENVQENRGMQPNRTTYIKQHAPLVGIVPTQFVLAPTEAFTEMSMRTADQPPDSWTTADGFTGT
jgi:hypothetical protein